MTTATRRAPVEVLPGQLWKDRDKRMNGRMLVVSRIDGNVVVCYYRTRPSKETRISLLELPKRFDLWQTATPRMEAECRP